MRTLLLRLAAPLQAWGDESKYDIRGTRNEPTKSGVIGMLAAAMGYSRDSKEIAIMTEKLRMGIRVDQPGTVIRDFHTAHNAKSSWVTDRYYLCDAVFLVALESEDEKYIDLISESLSSPVFPLYLGRRSCPPTQPLKIGIKDCDLENALLNEPWLASDWYKKKSSCIRARIITESSKGKKVWYTQMDQPVSFNPVQRKYSLRGLDREQYVLLGKSEHDPMTVL